MVAEATNGAEAVALTSWLWPHVVLTDLAMPQMYGVTAITQIKAQHQDVQILVLTSYDSDADIHGKLNVTDRTAAVIRALERGILR